MSLDLTRVLELSGVQTPPAFEVGVIATKLGLALVFGIAVAGTYALTRRSTASEAGSFSTTLVLLSLLVAMTTIVIDDSVARAFSLVGALAIVRFRTNVEDTRDTAFVIFAVVVGMAIGAGHTVVCVVGVPIVAATAFGAARLVRGRSDPGQVGLELALTVRVGAGSEREKAVAEVLRRFVSSLRLRSIVTVRQGVALDVRYSVRLQQPERPFDLVAELNRVEGVQQVEIGG